MRDRQQSFALRCEMRARRICTSDNGRETSESRIMYVVGAHDRIERAELADVAKCYSRDVIGCASDILRDLCDVLYRYVDEFRLRIDEAADQPWTGDAVDLRVLARDPFVL